MFKESIRMTDVQSNYCVYFSKSEYLRQLIKVTNMQSNYWGVNRLLPALSYTMVKLANALEVYTSPQQ